MNCKNQKNTGPCKTDTCDKDATTKGFCNSCYQKDRQRQKDEGNAPIRCNERIKSYASGDGTLSFTWACDVGGKRGMAYGREVSLDDVQKYLKKNTQRDMRLAVVHGQYKMVTPCVVAGETIALPIGGEVETFRFLVHDHDVEVKDQEMEIVKNLCIRAAIIFWLTHGDDVVFVKEA